MFCPKCGTNVKDDDYACYKCGFVLASNDKTEQVDISPVVQSISDIEETKNKTKKVLIGVVAGIASIVVIGGVLYANYYRSVIVPKKQLKEAISEDDSASVIDLMEQIDDEAIKAEAVESLLAHADELKNDYINENITFSEIRSELENIQETIGENNEQLNDINELVTTINESREIYDQAVEDYNSSDFSKAISEYSKVIAEDTKYYELAQEGLKQCDEAISLAVIGDWSFKYDMIDNAKGYLTKQGLTLPVNTLPATVLMTINDDGSINVKLEDECIDTYMDLMFNVAEQYVYSELEKSGIAKEQLETTLYLMYGSSDIKSIIGNFVDMDSLVKQIQDEFDNKGLDKYNVESGKIYINDICLNIDFSSDKIELSSEDTDTLKLGDVTYELPIELTKTEE